MTQLRVLGITDHQGTEPLTFCPKVGLCHFIVAKNIELLAKKLGAEIVGRVPEYSAGAFGVAVLAKALRERLEPSKGKRPG